MIGPEPMRRIFLRSVRFGMVETALPEKLRLCYILLGQIRSPRALLTVSSSVRHNQASLLQNTGSAHGPETNNAIPTLFSDFSFRNGERN